MIERNIRKATWKSKIMKNKSIDRDSNLLPIIIIITTESNPEFTIRKIVVRSLISYYTRPLAPIVSEV